MNPEIAEVFGYLTKDTDYSDFGKYHVFGREILKDDKIDLVILCDVIEPELICEIPQSKIVYMYSFIVNLNGFGLDFCANMNRYISKEKYDGVITGLSYLQFGIDAKLLNHEFGNLANPGQDIYFDFELFKWACSKNKDIKYCIT